MTDNVRSDRLRHLLTREARDRGSASVAVVDASGRSVSVAWTPDGAAEPAFLIYSVTKTVIAALALMLCEERDLSLDETLARWYPTIPYAPRIRVRQLLDHTSGIFDPLLSGEGCGLGLMVEERSRWGVIAGHNGGGPRHSASAFHALRTGVSVCVMTAIGEAFRTEAVVADVLDDLPALPSA